ncbi:MAG: nitrous oxide reductase family maturation protein NosD [Deltaproteobacteria bacterium]|nr:nitrous oxide reductase family maturation protein NosD [Deltaproteobacteria bacterium]
MLRVQVAPSEVSGDVREMDILGHYVGILPLKNFAPFEKRYGWIGLLAAAAAAAALPLLPRGLPRYVAVGVIVLVPIGFVLDLAYWQRYSITHMDPTVALNLIQDRIQTRIVGFYNIAQFKVWATFQEGFWFAVLAAMNALAFLWVEGKKSSVVGAAALLLLAVSAPANVAQAETLVVAPGSPFSTVGAAIGAAGSGDRIVVGPGLYRERILIDRPLSLQGDPGAVIDGGGTGTVVSITKGPVEIRGFLLKSSGASLLEEDAGIKLTGAEGCTVEDNRVEDTLFGILVNSSPKSRILNNQVLGKDLPVPRRGDGIRLNNSGDSTVAGNTVVRSRDLSIWESNRVSVRRNLVRESRYGLHYMYCDDNHFEGNVFEDNQVGAAVMYSRRLTLRNNRFTGSRGAGAVGLLIKAGDDIFAEGNWILNNTRGVFLDDSPQSLLAACEFSKNVIGGNDVGVSIQPAVDRALFTENAFIANRSQVEILGGVSRLRNLWSRGGRGNYWSDYVGFDAGDDGIGDTPYKIEEFFESLAERWPEAGLLRMSPAAEALEMASRAFPIGKPRLKVLDEHPLKNPPALLQEGLSTRRNPLLASAGVLVSAVSLYSLRIARRPLFQGGIS